MKKIEENEKKHLRFFIGMLMVGAILIIAFLSFIGNTHQIFNDIVNGYTAIHGSNKSAERTLFYVFSIVGVIVYVIYYLKNQTKDKIENTAMIAEKSDASLYVILALLVFSGVYYFVYSGTNWLLLSAMMLALALYASDKALIIPGTAFLFVCSYAVCALYRVYVFIGGHKSLSMMTVVLISTLASYAILFRNKHDLRDKIYLKGIMLLQIIVPFSMLVYLASRYKYGEEYIEIHIPYRIQIIIFGLIAVFVAEAVLNLRKNWTTVSGLGDVVSCGTCIAIMSFNRYSGSGSIIPTDLHHPFENIIGYTQIVELGQKAFAEYIPISGMYSVLQGFFFSFLGHGQVSFYYLTTNLFFLTAIIFIVVLLKQQLKGEWVLFISLIFYVTDYDRITFILPIMLLLAWPKLIERRNLWLKAWFLTSFLHGLYYPLFGAAVCLGYLPLGVWQIMSYAKSGDLKNDIKKLSFWFWWLICCIPVGLSFGALLGTLKHMMAMGGQAVYSEGIARFGQAVPNNFLSYIPLLSIRLVIYYIFSFLIVVSIVWISAVLFLKTGNARISGKKITVENPVSSLISISFGIALLIAFSYTVVRMDPDSIYARSAGMVYASFVMIVLIVSRYLISFRSKHYIFCFAVFIIAAVSAEGFLVMETGSKLTAYYTVPEDYVHVVNDQVEKLGECFVERATYESIENTYNWAMDLDREKSYLGIVENFGLYYLCNLKGDSVMEIDSIRGYGAAQETVDLIRENHTVVGTIMYSVNMYYFWYWLVTSGEYVWSSDTRIFIPNDGSVSKKEALLQNKDIDLAVDGGDIGRTAGSWGNSMNTLKSIFSDVDEGYNMKTTNSGLNIVFDESIDGDDADFIYLEFADVDQNYDYILFTDYREEAIQDTRDSFYLKRLMKKDYNRGVIVIVSWTDENGNAHSMNCGMEQGKLLIPIGAGRGWLLNAHSNIKISVMEGEEVIAVPEITEFRLLKLREVE